MPQLLFLCTLSKKNLKSIFITNLKERFPIPNILNNNVKYVPLPSQQIALVLLYFYSVYNNSKELYYRIVKINLDPSSEKEVLQYTRASTSSSEFYGLRPFAVTFRPDPGSIFVSVFRQSFKQLSKSRQSKLKRYFSY